MPPSGRELGLRPLHALSETRAVSPAAAYFTSWISVGRQVLSKNDISGL